MKVVFYCVKGAGHVNPTLPVVRALVAAGHEIAYSLTEEWEDRVEATGATFWNVAGTGPFTTADYHPSPMFPLQVIPAAAAIAPRLVDEARAFGADLVVHDSMAVWGRLVAGALGVPAVVSVPTLVLDDLDAAGAPLSVMRDDALNREASQTIRERFGDEVGWDAPMGWFLGPENLVFSCERLNPVAARLPGRFHFVGASVDDANAAATLAEHGLDRVGAGGRRLVYVALGTLAVQVLGLDAEFFRPFLDAVADRDDTDLVISVGRSIDPEALGPLPSNVIARRHIPQVALLGRADVFFTHAGANSMHEGFLHGVPLVCVPCFAEQPYNAARVAAAGAGVVLPREALSSATVREALERVTSDPSYRETSRRIGADLRAAGGAPRAAEVLERIASAGLTRPAP